MPQKQKSADEIIAEAKAAYKSAGGGQMHEYSNAPYSTVKATPAPAAKPADTGIKKEAHDTGASIKSNMDNARKALAQ